MTTEPKHTPFEAIDLLREVGTVLNGASHNPNPSVLLLREAVCRIDRAASSIEMDAKGLLADNQRLREALRDVMQATNTFEVLGEWEALDINRVNAIMDKARAALSATERP